MARSRSRSPVRKNRRSRSRSTSRDRYRSSRRKSRSISPQNQSKDRYRPSRQKSRSISPQNQSNDRYRPSRKKSRSVSPNNQTEKFKGFQRPANRDKFKDFRARATEGGFGARNNRGSLSAFSDEYFDHRRNEREKTGVNGVREAWSSSPNRLEWPESLVDIFGINKKERKG